MNAPLFQDSTYRQFGREPGVHLTSHAIYETQCRDLFGKYRFDKIQTVVLVLGYVTLTLEFPILYVSTYYNIILYYYILHQT